MDKGVPVRIRRFPVQTPLSTKLSLGTQPRYKAPSDLWVEIVKMQWLTLSEWGCPHDNGPKLAMGQPNNSPKNDCNWTRTQNHLVLKRTLNHLASLAKWLSVRLRTKWFWVRVQLQSLHLQISRLLRARSSLTFRQL